LFTIETIILTSGARKSKLLNSDVKEDSKQNRLKNYLLEQKLINNKPILVEVVIFKTCKNLKNGLKYFFRL